VSPSWWLATAVAAAVAAAAAAAAAATRGDGGGDGVGDADADERSPAATVAGATASDGEGDADARARGRRSTSSGGNAVGGMRGRADAGRPVGPTVGGRPRPTPPPPPPPPPADAWAPPARRRPPCVPDALLAAPPRAGSLFPTLDTKTSKEDKASTFYIISGLPSGSTTGSKSCSTRSRRVTIALVPLTMSLQDRAERAAQ